jgi:NTE family protein
MSIVERAVMRKIPKAMDLLGSLGPIARRVLEAETSALVLPAGHHLFREGDAGDACYVVTSGSLGIYVRGAVDEDRLISLVGAGETVGEMSLISGQPRSASVTAIRDTELLRLSKQQFDRLLKNNPDIMSGVMRILVHRLRRLSNDAGATIEPKTVAFLPAHENTDCREVASALARRLEADGKSVKFVGPEGLEQDTKWFNNLEAAHDFVFLSGSQGNAAWIRLCARQADRIFVVADASRQAQTSLPDELLKTRARHQLLDLVLLHRAGVEVPSGAEDWTRVVHANRHFHVRLGNTDDWERLARVTSGNAIGIILSGGGARAFAHLGVIRAFEERGIPIDFIGGTSMGALIGAGLAMGWPTAELVERLRTAFVNKNPLNDITLPMVGMVKGRKVERLLQSNFGGRKITNLWRPFFCVSTNLTAGNVYVHRRGSVRDALRATIALPGILPPFVHEQGVLVDGAATNNLPVDVMRNIHRGPIVAVDVAQDRAVGPELLADHETQGWYQRLTRPPIVSILMRSATISSEEQDRQQAQNADLVIAPPLGDIEIRDWKAFDQTVEIGYEHAVKALSKAPFPPRRRADSSA